MARHRTEVQARWADMDLLGHVNNVTYLVYLEEARVRLLVDVLQRAALSAGQVVARHEIDYVAPLVPGPDPVVVETWVTDIGRSSYRLAYEVTAGGVLRARASSVLVKYDLASGRATPFTDAEVAALQGLRDDAADEPA